MLLKILYMVKKGGHPVRRPDLSTDGEIEVNSSLIHLIRDCWTERPSERPTITMVKSQMNSMDSRNGNLMDYVFNILEKYASPLEEEVADRTKELVEEKKKSDVLLYRMLPRQVAEKLKLGKSVEPETFDSVTVFFSDVVSFTTIAAKGSPLQVVDLLNDLYTTFDSIIDEHDVYKVETIGDGYLCASGLPNRNGSVVTGVVGLTMPPYCLFGDTVNTASRMESNGKRSILLFYS
ncbi:putative phage head-tail adaptor [Dictyocaulus viviparus]|uniref:guanylate cyclase n=1 Tax=Dictyocaulus viviparus TaxID=29172 RepID=A0A0D8XNZ4_DICVI|nr:putative phage head-tail adaptor [Dictyocaulus viviparus]